jgi:hypothetical protein
LEFSELTYFLDMDVAICCHKPDWVPAAVYLAISGDPRSGTSGLLTITFL